MYSCATRRVRFVFRLTMQVEIGKALNEFKSCVSGKSWIEIRRKSRSFIADLKQNEVSALR